MANRPASPPLPDSTGAWIACFRHRVRDEQGRSLSPEQFAPLIACSGATVRRWESNRSVPDEGDIARIARAARLTRQQHAFLSAASTRVRAMPAPDERDFKEYMTEVLCRTPYPAMVIDGLFHIRAWNSLVNALGPNMSRSFTRDIHPIAMMLRADPGVLFRPDQHIDSLRAGLRIFWMTTAVYSHRPEYRALVNGLRPEPHFLDLWTELALGDCNAPREPITLAHSIAGRQAAFRVYACPISFPPLYYVYEYQPADDEASRRLEAVAGSPLSVHFNSRLHWVDTTEEE
jgi:hypothetical protein